jgi:hypothetical protein
VKVTPNTDHIDQISDLYISQKLQWRQNDYNPYEKQSRSS